MQKSFVSAARHRAFAPYVDNARLVLAARPVSNVTNAPKDMIELVACLQIILQRTVSETISSVPHGKRKDFATVAENVRRVLAILPVKNAMIEFGHAKADIDTRQSNVQ